MKLLVIAIVCGFANVHDSMGEVDSGGLTAAFVTGGNSVPASTIEGQPTENLREIILNETALYMNHIVNDLERQINIQSHLEVTVLKLALETFNYEVEQLPVDATADSLDLALHFLNIRIGEAFDLIPATLGGNAVAKPKKLSAKKDKLSSGDQKPPKVHTLFELMNSLGQVVEKDLEMLYKFQKKLLSAGYAGVDTASLEIQEEFRTLAINEHLIPALQLIMRDVKANEEIAQAHVNALTWTKFLALSDQLSTVMANSGITETTEVNEVTTETSESDEVTTEASESDEVTTEASELDEVTNDTSESDEVTNDTSELDEVTNDTSEIDEVTSETDEITEQI